MPRNPFDTPLRLGILGCGSFMQRRILTALPDAPLVRVVNVQKRDATEAEAVSRKFGVPGHCATREALLADPQVEAVFIGTPNSLHEEDALACAAAGKHVLCEKPMAPTALGVARMVEAFKKAGLRLLVGHCFRFKAAAKKSRTLVHSGALGDLVGMRGFYSVFLGPGAWRFDWNMGGGVIQDIGIHVIDGIRFISGQEIVAVSAMADRGFSPKDGRADKTIRAVFRLESGILASMEVSFEEAFRNGIEALGSKGLLTGWGSLRQSHDPGESLRLVNDDGATELRLSASNVYAEELNHFARVVAGQEEPLIDGMEGLANQFVVDALYRSIAERREVEVK